MSGSLTSLPSPSLSPPLATNMLYRGRGKKIKHRPGTQMVVPDALSRKPMSLGTVEP
jgi:hypothetical protein